MVHSVRITKLIPWVINKAGLLWDALHGQMSEHDLDLEGGEREREREREIGSRHKHCMQTVAVQGVPKRP